MNNKKNSRAARAAFNAIAEETARAITASKSAAVVHDGGKAGAAVVALRKERQLSREKLDRAASI